MSEKECVEKPKIEPLESTSLYTVELCSPIKEQLNKIEICEPHIEVKFCGPLREVKNFSDFAKLMICLPPPLMCTPDIRLNAICVPCYPVCLLGGICIPEMVCDPRICNPACLPSCLPSCLPVCFPLVKTTPAYEKIEFIGEKIAKIDEIAEKVEHLLTEIKDIKSKVR